MAKLRLNMGIAGISGRAGTAVFAQTQYGTVLRSRPTYSKPRTAAQQQIARNLSRANAAWRELTPAQAQAWQLYCLTLTADNAATGLPVTPHAPQVFLGYASKILQMNPQASVPSNPPTTPFYGDNLHCTLTGISGKIRITASAANAPGVTTEILVQRLRAINNAPQPKSYKTATFRAFAVGGLTLEIDQFAAAFAVAIRFVDVASGRKTALYPVGKVTVLP